MSKTDIAPSCPFAQEHMRGAFAGNHLFAPITKRVHIEAVEQMLTPAKQHRSYRKMHFVDARCAQQLPYGRYAAADTHILAIGC
jgi:NAD-dependent oxidoreductase involved in siderophore biosynthesis